MNTNEISALVKASIETKFWSIQVRTRIHRRPGVRCTQQGGNEHGGKPEHYDHEQDAVSTWLVSDQIRVLLMSAVIEHVNALAPQITEAVKSRLQAADIVDSFARRFSVNNLPRLED